MKKNRKTVFVGMSGGVDSSVAAILLQRRGYNVVGVFLRGYNIDGCQERDAEDARRVAERLGVPFYVWDCEEEYKRHVVDYMVESYRRGLTPNPDVMCNKEIKFGVFLKLALAAGADYVATGHHVRRAREGKRLLQVAKDSNKDQSYFLWTLTPEQLKYCLFPIGDYLKPEVRAMARRAKLPVAEKKDSQGICFLGQVTMEEFLRRYIPEQPGMIVDAAGRQIGRHRGVSYYTIGQRHGVGVAGQGQPYYVAGKDVATNTLRVAEAGDQEALSRRDMVLTGVQWYGPRPTAHARVMARIRYRQPVSSAEAIFQGQDALRLAFAKPQRFVAPGQSAVLYDAKGRILGGGIIT